MAVQHLLQWLFLEVKLKVDSAAHVSKVQNLTVDASNIHSQECICIVIQTNWKNAWPTQSIFYNRRYCRLAGWKCQVFVGQKRDGPFERLALIVIFINGATKRYCFGVWFWYR